MSTPYSQPDSSPAEDARPRWTEGWRELADEAPPVALESRLMAAFDARASQHASHSRPRHWSLGLALAASLALAAVLGTHPHWHADAPTQIKTTAGTGSSEATFSGDGEALRSIDRALLQARMDAATDDGNDAYEDSLWQARRRVLSDPDFRDGVPYEADIDPLMI